MELEIPTLIKIIAALLTVGGVVFFKDYEKYIGKTWTVILLLFTAFLTLSSLFGYTPREIMCTVIRCPPSDSDVRIKKLSDQIAQQNRQLADLKRSSNPSQAQIDGMNQRLSTLEGERAKIAASPDSTFTERFKRRWEGNP